MSTAEQPFLGQTGLVGHCVSLMPFLIELHPDEDAMAFVRRVQRDLAEAMDHLSFTTVNLLEELVSSSRTQMSPIPVGLTGVKKFSGQRNWTCADSPSTTSPIPKASSPSSGTSARWSPRKGSKFMATMTLNSSTRRPSSGGSRSFEEILAEMVAQPSIGARTLAQLEDGSPVSSGLLFNFAARDIETEPSERLQDFALSNYSASNGAAPAQSVDALLPALVKLFQRVLGRRTIGADDNFFDLGGHSVNAARLFALIERELHITAPLAALYEAPTPRALARVMAGGIDRNRWQALVPIRTSGNRIPLFLVHGAEGNVLLYRGLAKHLGDDQPVYGLQSAGLDGSSSVDGNFERVARRYVDEIRTVQAEGPTCLAATAWAASSPWRWRAFFYGRGRPLVSWS